MGHFKVPKFSKPHLTRESLGLTPWVKYDKYNPHSDQSTDARKSLADLDYSPLRRVTLQSFLMGILISMGGFIFGYDTGQISGFLEMPDFLQRFGQRHDDGTYYFSNVRAGLIVALVSTLHTYSPLPPLTLAALHRYAHRCPGCRSCGRYHRQKNQCHCLVWYLLHWQHRHDLLHRSLVPDDDGQMGGWSWCRRLVSTCPNVHV